MFVLNIFNLALLSFFLLNLPSFSAQAGEGGMGPFTFTLSGYVGSNVKCDRDGGGPQSCCGFGNPQSWASMDGKSEGGKVGLAVGKSMRKYMGCRVTIPDMGEYRIRDYCPICDQLKRLDVSFSDKACGKMKTFKKNNVQNIIVHTDDCEKGSRGTASAKRKQGGN